MQKTLNCEIRRDTWTKNTPSIVLSTALNGAKNVDILQFLLTIGYCTVPAHVAKYSINTMWAWVRYLGAFSDNKKFELQHDFSELDPHQKTILSDDFGMGMSLHLLADALELVNFCDGKYFIDRLAPRLGCSTKASTAKRGPRKSPDFVAQDNTGKLHVIECKGTQSGRSYALNQLRTARRQKGSVRIASAIKGESLATGFMISGEATDWESNFIIADPEPEDPLIDLTANQQDEAKETISRGKIARSLALAGASSLSQIVAAPFGDHPGQMPGSQRTDDQRNRTNRLLEESLIEKKHLLRFDNNFVGREAIIDLPFTFSPSSRSFSKACVKVGINPDIIGSLTDGVNVEKRPDDEDFLSSEDQKLASQELQMQQEDTGARLKDGNLLFSDIELM